MDEGTTRHTARDISDGTQRRVVVGGIHAQLQQVDGLVGRFGVDDPPGVTQLLAEVTLAPGDEEIVDRVRGGLQGEVGPARQAAQLFGQEWKPRPPNGWPRKSRGRKVLRRSKIMGPLPPDQIGCGGGVPETVGWCQGPDVAAGTGVVATTVDAGPVAAAIPGVGADSESSTSTRASAKSEHLR